MNDPHAARPNKLVLEDKLQALAHCYLELSCDLDRRGDKSAGGSSKTRLPLNEDVLDAMRDVDNLAYTYANQLRAETTDWRPPPQSQGTAGVLLALATRAGHFTLHPDPIVAFDFNEDVENTSVRAWRTARPTGITAVPLGIRCQTGDCPGELRVRIDRDKPLDTAELALWRPDAVCYLRGDDGVWKPNPDRDHRIDAKFAAAHATPIGDETTTT